MTLLSRYEEGKLGEVFTLVIKGTAEEAWYNTSTVGKSYIEIDEDELKEVLAGVEVNNINREGVASGTLFRI